MTLTSSQQKAIAARGNVLVVAGAGTGKTSTLVERCMDCVLHEKPQVSLDEILIVTFTDAAAAEVRKRIRDRLEAELIQSKAGGDSDVSRHLEEQLAIFETAHIGTLHSFCLQLVRQHFYALDLDPQLSVLPAEETRLLAHETLEALLQRHYTGRTPQAEAVQQLIQVQARGSDQPVRALVLRLHHYAQTLPDPAAWFREQLDTFAEPNPVLWQDWLMEALAEWPARWLPILKSSENDVSRECVETLQKLPAQASRAERIVALEAILAACENCPRGKKGEWLKPLKDFLAEADFLYSLVRVAPESSGAGVPPVTQGVSPSVMSAAREGETPGITGGTPAPLGIDPLVEDWNWVRPQMTTILQLAQEFGEAFSESKRELGMVDFHDLEQHALRLLWDAKAGQPTKIAQQWRKKLRLVFVDEYQDINAAQDKIIEAISREGRASNRFLVGDVKQSIYRFRLADPYIFQNYVKTWGNGAGQVIPLVENFRSREKILAFINSLFTVIMQPELGGVHYDQQARLQFGAPGERSPLSIAEGAALSVELHLRLKAPQNKPDADEENLEALATVAEMEEADKEARLVALRLRELKAQRHQIWDERAKAFRAVEWRDMAILLRSPSNKAESYAKEFARLNVPLLVERGGFYESMEILDLLSLLQLLDNPLQDLPALAVLHSPLVGLTLDELAAIRLTTNGPFWTALSRWAESHETRNTEYATRNTEPSTLNSQHATAAKVIPFLTRFAHWRRLSRQASLSRCLETVLSETHYAEWLLTQPRGQQRQANVQRLVGLARQFDQFQRQGLFRFLRFIEAQKSADTEPEVAAVSEENSIRLMSIHQSKGLEFPVVVVADLGKPFNVSDLQADVILDEKYGLCPQIKPPHTGKRYPSLPCWLARQRQRREMLGEELRLLYVATTRARDTLILSGAISKTRFDSLWLEKSPVTTQSLQSARSYSDWLGFWFSQSAGGHDDAATEGRNDHLQWFIHDDAKLIATAESHNDESDAFASADPAIWEQLQQRFSWSYPFAAATHQPAKTSVSILRRRAAEDLGEESALFPVQGSRFEVQGSKFPTPRFTLHASRSAAPSDVGTAHHTFLQLLSLDRVGSIADLRGEAARLVKEGAISAAQVAMLDFDGLAAFWQSDVGRKVLSKVKNVQRELAFTMRYSAKELAAVTGQTFDPKLEDEFVVIQGAADLAVLLPQEIWLIDFKTDRFDRADLPNKVKIYEPQLKLYAQALSRIYRRPVSHTWLYFLAVRTAVRINGKDAVPSVPN